MPTFFNKTLLVILLCLSFISQSMASMTMAYDMLTMQAIKQQAVGEKAQQHDMSDCHQEMSTKVTPDITSTECCDQDCKCLASSCASVTAFLTMMAYPDAHIISSKIMFAPSALIKETYSSLFRPPILRKS